jgi:tetratricopeptide (TPR) repeat protein
MRRGSALVPTLLLVLAGALGAQAGEAEDVAPSLSMIEKLRAAGDLDGAFKEAASLVAKHPESLEAHVAWQDLQLSLGHEKEALDTYRPAAHVETATADAHYLFGRLQRGNPAIVEYRAAVKIDPKHFWALCGLGIELTHVKGYGEARTTLEAAQALQPASAVPVNALGRLEEARGKPAEAEKLYRAALELDPAMTVARVNLGVLLVGLARQEEAMKTLEDAAKRAPKDPMPLLGIGMAQMAAKNAKAAADAYRKAVALDNHDVTSLNLLAAAYIDLDQADFAEEALNQAIKIAPDSLVTKVNLAYCRIAKGLTEEASRMVQSVVAADDTMAEAHYLLGLIYDKQVQYKKADAEFRRAEKLDDDNPTFCHALAAFAETQGDWTTAIAEFTKYAKLTKNSSDALFGLAGAYRGAGKHRSAASTYDQLVAAEPGRLDAWLQLGIVCGGKLNENKRALKAFQEYLNRGGKDPRVPGWIRNLEAATK